MERRRKKEAYHSFYADARKNNRFVPMDVTYYTAAQKSLRAPQLYMAVWKERKEKERDRFGNENYPVLEK